MDALISAPQQRQRPPEIAKGGIQKGFFINGSGAYPYTVFHAEVLRIVQKVKVSRRKRMAARRYE
jgi:hypothetical protein